MDVTILNQGYNPASDNSVGKQLMSLLKREDFHSFIGITAFSSLAGVNGLAPFIEEAKKRFQSLAIVTGVDQKGTSKEALEALFNLGIGAYVFYQPSVSIFHPKIYLFEGEKSSELIIGSSNLTTHGLFANVEASILMSLDHSNPEDLEVIKELKDSYHGIFQFNDPNIKPITPELIEELVNAKIVPTEIERTASQDKGEEIPDSTRENISKIFPKRELSKVPGEFRAKKAQPPVEYPVLETEAKAEEAAAVSSYGRLVWARKKLPGSSVQSAGVGTNPTGGLRLVQDRFVVNGSIIDQTAYFRNTVFGKFIWKQVNSSPLVEGTEVPFDITIKGKNIGIHSLEVRHKPSGEAGQGNYTTSISWGSVGSEIQKANLTNCRLELYSPLNEGEPYKIVII